MRAAGEAPEPAHVVLALAVTPRGHLRLDRAAGDADDPPAGVASRIEAAFARGTGAGVLHLGAAEPATPLPPSLAFFRDIGQLFVTALSRLTDAEERRAALDLPVPTDELEARVAAAPPLEGLEYLTPGVLEALWSALNAAARRELGEWEGDVESWLQARSPLWHSVGRVCFHLAENKASETKPFAFLATFATRLSDAGRVQHQPLGHAVKTSGAARDREALRSLLVPVQRASEKSPFVKALVDSGEVFRPLAWTSAQAWSFLREAPLLEESGVLLRLPDWWRKGAPPRPEVRVTVGEALVSGVGGDSLLDFSVELTLGGETLTAAERRQILASTAGLALVRGRWVEIDPAELKEALARLAKAAEAQGEGVGIGEALRLAAGLGKGAGEGDCGGWVRVEPGRWLAKALESLRTPEGRAAADPGPALLGTLRPYQRDGVSWLHTLSKLRLGGCLADDMGLGKTIQVLALLLSLKRAGEKGPHLLVVPASLVANWMAEIARFAPSLSVFVAHPSVTPAKELADAAAAAGRVDVTITTYATLLRLPALQEARWGLVVLDEAQAIKNPSAKQTRAVKALASRGRLALTGTPVENRLGDLWSLFDFLQPGLLGSAKEFGAFAKARASSATPDWGPLRRLVRPFILRRLKTDRSVISDLPEKTEMKVFCPLSKTQAVLYQQAVGELARLLAAVDGMKRRGVVLSYLMRFKQLCNHPSQWLRDGRFDPKESGKLGRLAALGEEIASRQEKALVFTQFQEMTGPLASFLAGVFGRPGLVLHGGTPVAKRRALVEDFQREDGPPFFVVSVKAGGTGLNLTEASHVVHFDRWWNPAVEDQATDRAFRIGQKRNVLVHKLVCRGTVEERIDALIEAKKALARDVLEGGAEARLTELSDAELLRLVSLDLAAATAE
jgi:non-specific serine/threonine protein kinase